MSANPSSPHAYPCSGLLADRNGRMTPRDLALHVISEVARTVGPVPGTYRGVTVHEQTPVTHTRVEAMPGQVDIGEELI